jgi:hypothetical protein
MKRFELCLWLLLNITFVQAQLLTNPDLSVKDIELSLKNPDHLRGILLEHRFSYAKLDDQPCKRADSWESQEEFRIENISTSILGLVILEWNEDVDDPYPNAAVTISVQLTECPLMQDRITVFEESIRNEFPIRNVRTRDESDPFLVYSKPGTKIEVELITIKMDFNTRLYNFTLFE